MGDASAKSQVGCGGGHGAPALSVDEALRRIEAAVEPVSGVEKLALRSALGRILANDILSPVNVPSHTNSAMDGYAVAAGDLPNSGTAALSVVGTSWAGRPFAGVVHQGQCVRIMTGATMPEGVDTVIMQEHVQREGDVIRVGTGHKAGQNVRAAGEDLVKGEVALTAGKQISPAELGLLASLGIGEVAVQRRVRVAFFSTGDELRSIGEPLSEGEIYDSNRYSLYGMLSRLGVEIIDMGVVRDDREATKEAFIQAARNADAIVTSGGVSVGEADYVKETLDILGDVGFWQIAMKPGRPLAFGRVQDAVFFGLPGNPVSVMVTFYQFVEPALRRMMGQTDVHPVPVFKVRCASRLKKSRGRTEFQRAILERDTNGELVVRSTGQQGSGLLHSMSAANCFVILPQDAETVEPETLVDVQPFYGII
ncbi:MAG: gephyrin-like molybdotransferase Glp [Acidiferrobacterales bacterium]